MYGGKGRKRKSRGVAAVVMGDGVDRAGYRG
jgi:hypothetical protein